MAAGGKQATNISTVSLVVLVAVTFLTSLYMKGLNSGIPLYYDSIGYSATVGGTFVAVFTLASTAMRLVGGQITDQFPHYCVLMASLVALFFGAALPALWNNFYMQIASRVLQGASFALATNVMTVAVMGSASKKHLGKRLGIKSAGTSLGTMLGALVSTGLLDGIGYQGFFAFYAAIMALSIGAVVLLKRKESTVAKAAEIPDACGPKNKPGKQNGSTAITAHLANKNTGLSQPTRAPEANGAAPATTAPKAATNTSTKQRLRSLVAPYLMPQLAPYMAISFSRRIIRGFCITFILIFAKFADIGSGALFFVAAGATTLACSLFGGKLFDSNKTWLLFPLLCVEVVGFAILTLTPSFISLMVAAVGYGISVGAASPFVKALTAKAAPKEHWGVVNGELYFFGDLGKALGAFGGGLIIDATGKAFVPGIALGISLFAAIVTGVAVLISHRSAA